MAGFISPYRRGGSTNDPSADFALALEQHPLLNGELIENLVTAASTADQEFRHDLGRAYRFVFLLPYDGTLRIRAPSASSDSTLYFVVAPSSAAAITFTAWVV